MSSPRKNAANYAESVESFATCCEEANITTSILNKGVLLDIKSVFDGIKMSLYKFDIMTIANELNVWAFNRKLNEEHVNNLYNDFVKHRYPHFIGNIKVVMDEENNCQIIDGQHRLAVIRKYIDEGHKAVIETYIDVYHVQSLTHPDVFTLFKMANTNLNVTVEDDVNMHIAEVVDALATDPELYKGIIDKNDGRVQKPKIAKKELYELLKTNIKAQDLRLPVEEIVRRIKIINTLIGTKSNLELFGRKDPSQTNLNMKGRADAHNFYLNLHGRYTPERWIEMISSTH